MREGTWSRRDLVKKKLGQGKTWLRENLVKRKLGQEETWSRGDLVEIRCCLAFSEVDLQIIKLPLRTLCCSLRQGDGSPTSCRLLAFKSQIDLESSLLLYLTRFLAHLVSRFCFCFMGS